MLMRTKQSKGSLLCHLTVKALAVNLAGEGGETKTSSSAVCVPIVFVFNIDFNTDTQGGKEDSVQRPWGDGAASLQAWVSSQMCPCVQHPLWAWTDLTFCSVTVFLGGCPDLSLWAGSKAASGFTPCSTKVSKQNTVSPNCESWNYLWTWPLESEPQTSLITFGDLCTGYHGDENNIWNSSLV